MTKHFNGTVQSYIDLKHFLNLLIGSIYFVKGLLTLREEIFVAIFPQKRKIKLCKFFHARMNCKYKFGKFFF